MCYPRKELCNKLTTTHPVLRPGCALLTIFLQVPEVVKEAVLKSEHLRYLALLPMDRVSFYSSLSLERKQRE